MIRFIFIPIVAGLVSLLVPRRFKQAQGAFCFLVCAYMFISAYLLFLAKPAAVFLGKNVLVFSLDNLSGFVILFVSFFAFIITLYSLGSRKTREYSNLYYPSILVTLGACFGAVLASNFLVLLVFWGMLGITLYLLVNEAGPQASEASKKTFIIVGGADVILLLGIALFWHITNTLQMNAAPVALSSRLPVVAYLCIAIAAFAKAGAMPFHSWIPDAAEKGPVPVTAFLPASLDKLVGIYLLARVSISVFKLNAGMGAVLMAVGSVTILAAAMMALVQHDAKRLLAYHAVSQVGYMVLGIGTLNPIGIAGGIFHMLNHAIYKSCLFLTAGNVEEEAGTSDLDKLGGLAKYMPVTFVCFIIAAFSISGVPPFNGFVSKWMIYQGAIELGRAGGKLWIIWLTAAMFGSALTLASFMKLTHAIFLGARSDELKGKKIKEGEYLMVLPAVILSALCVIFGVFAYAVPLRYFIAPAVSGNILLQGLWSPALATLLIVIGLLIGVAIYFMGTLKATRTERAFTGGEKLQDAERVTGTDFYQTIKEMPFIGNIYNKAQNKMFDIYDLGKAFIGYFSDMLQRAHSGLLPVYIIWCLAGMALLYVALLFKG